MIEVNFTCSSVPFLMWALENFKVISGAQSLLSLDNTGLGNLYNYFLFKNIVTFDNATHFRAG